MTISRMQQPRQMYGLGSLVKKAVKGVTGAVKSFAKSDLGKAAGLAALAFGIPGAPGALGGGLFGRAKMFGPATGLFGQQGIGPTFGAFKSTPFGEAIFGKAIGDTDMTRTGGLLNFLKTPGGAFAGITAASALAAAGLDPENPNEMPRNTEALKSYLRQGYLTLNPQAQPNEVEEFVEANTVEYRANGGRIGFADGMLSFEEAKAMNPGMFIDTTTSAYGDAGEGKPVPRYFEDKMETLNESKEGMSPRSRIAIFKQYLDEALATGQISKEKYQEMLMPLLGQQGEKITEQIKEYENFANGGRIGYAFGNQPEQNAIRAAGIMNLPLNQNPAGVTELDLRETGGFIPPVGVKEKEDDIPAMLSNNEFVFTADAVRGMGDGDVNIGAQRMYDMMKKLENGGRV